MIPWSPYLRLVGASPAPAAGGDQIARAALRLVRLVERLIRARASRS
jgi:hypothetical protein